MGSSPRVRGEVSIPTARFCRTGIIPAGAGRRLTEPTTGLTLVDHPRGCGEKELEALAAVCFVGSSPRVRGEGRSPPSSLCRRGIIPAGAGRSEGVEE